MEKIHQTKRLDDKPWYKRLSINDWIISPYYVILVGLIIVPLIIMLFYSVQSTESNYVLSTTFTLEYYIRFFSHTGYIQQMMSSVWMAVVSTIICVIIGYPLAYIISRQKKSTQALLIVLITCTMWIFMIVRTYALQSIFRLITSSDVLPMLRPYLINNDIAAYIGMVYMFLPYMVLPIYSVLAKMDKHYIEGAADLGANKFQTFVKVVFPLSLTGVIAGISLVLLPATTTIIIPEKLGNNSKFSIGKQIEFMVMRSASTEGFVNTAAAITIVLSVVMLVIIILLRKLDRFKGGEES